MRELMKPPSQAYGDQDDNSVTAYATENDSRTVDLTLDFLVAQSDNTRVGVLQPSESLSSAHWQAGENVAWQTVTGGAIGAASAFPDPRLMLLRGGLGASVGFVNAVRSSCYSCHVYGK